MKRRRLTPRQAIQVALQQRAVIVCFRCEKAFTVEDAKQIEIEHLHELELGGADEIENMRWSHKECHAKITNGTKAGTAGSSKHRIAKAKRIAKGGKKRKGPAIQSRGFQKPPDGYSAWRKSIKDMEND